MFTSIYSKTSLLGNSYIKYQQFNPPIHKGVKHTKQHTIKKSAPRTGQTKARSAQQKRTRIMSIGLCNLSQTTDGYIKFLTLTAGTPTRNLKLWNRTFTKFIQRWEYKLGYKIKYIAIPEVHNSPRTSDARRNTYHMHAIFFNVPYVSNKEIQTIWGQGIVYTKGIEVKQGYKGLSYVLKYLTKEQTLNARVLMPRHMLRPVVVYNVNRPNLTPLYEHSTIILEADTTVSTALYKVG